MRPDLEDKYGFLEIQDKILGIMVDVDRFCEEHDNWRRSDGWRNPRRCSNRWPNAANA